MAGALAGLNSSFGPEDDEVAVHFVTLPAAVRISLVTAAGWETSDAWDASISTVCEWARLAMNVCVAGGIALS
jgi:hypothetical protein